MTKFNSNTCKATFEKSQFGGFRAKVILIERGENSSPIFLGATGYVTKEVAIAAAQAYLEGYDQLNNETANRFLKVFNKENNDFILNN